MHWIYKYIGPSGKRADYRTDISASIADEWLNQFKSKMQTPLFVEMVQDNSVIELGARDILHFRNCIDAGALEYIVVDPAYTNEEIQIKKRITSDEAPNYAFQVGFSNIDGLNFLKKRKKNSAVILSTGLFDDDLVLSRDYAKKLIKEILKVTKDNGLTMHTFSGGENYLDLFLSHHFLHTEDFKGSKGVFFLRKNANGRI